VTDARDLLELTVSEPTAESRSSSAGKLVLWRFGLPVVAFACASGMWLNPSREQVGVLAIVMMLALMSMKLPLGVAMAVPGVLGLWSILGWTAAAASLRQLPYDSTASWSLSVVPMFIFMGTALWRSGITGQIYSVAQQWFGWLPGGLAIGTNMAGAGFAALSGSTLGSMFPLARSGVPEMLKAGYDRRLAVASVMSAGTLAHLIPPSLFLVLYAGVAEVAIGPQLLAGLIPGLILAGLYVVAIIGVAVVRPSSAGRDTPIQRATWRQRWAGLWSIAAAPVLVLVVIVGLYSGVFTATESAAVGAFGALVILLVRHRKSRPLAAVAESMSATLSTVGAIFFLLIGAFLLSRLITVSGLANQFISGILDLNLSRTEFLLVLALMYLFLGMLMDSLAMMLLTVPILLPVLSALDVSEIWFGVYVVIFMELAVVTPPVGVLAYIMHGIVQDPDVNRGQSISLGDIFTAVALFMPVTLLLLAILILFPDLATWLPEHMSSG